MYCNLIRILDVFVDQITEIQKHLSDLTTGLSNLNQYLPTSRVHTCVCIHHCKAYSSTRQ